MKQQIPREKKEEIEDSLLRTVRVWLMFAIVLYIPVQVFNIFRKEDPVAMADQIFHWVMMLLVIVMVVWSCIGSLKSITVGIILLQVRVYYSLFQLTDIVHTSDDARKIIIYTVAIIQVCYTNQVIICQIFQNHYNKLNVAMYLIMYLGFFHRLIGLEYIVSNINLIVILAAIGLALGLIVQLRISSIRMGEFREINHMIYNLKMAQVKDKELIFDSLDQGILLVRGS